MPAFDHGVKAIAGIAGRELARLAGVACQRLEPIESTLQTTELLADRVFRATQGRERFVVYMEFYTRWTDEAPWDILAKSGLLSKRERLPTKSLAFILKRRGYRPQGGQLQLAVAGKPTQGIWFEEIRLWEQEPQPWWEDAPALMALYPLCRHGRQPPEVIRHAAAVIEARTADPLDRADLLAYLCFFGQLAFPRLDVGAIIGREKMIESKFWREVAQEAAVGTMREAVHEVLEGRFGADAAREFATAVGECNDMNRLKQLHKLAVRCASIDEFRTAVQAPARRRKRTTR